MIYEQERESEPGVISTELCFTESLKIKRQETLACYWNLFPTEHQSKRI